MAEAGLLCKEQSTSLTCPKGFYLAKRHGNFSCFPILPFTNICQDKAFVKALGNRVVCDRGIFSGVVLPCEDDYKVTFDKEEPICQLQNYVTLTCQSDVNGTVPSCIVEKSACPEECNGGATSGKTSCTEIRLQALHGCHPPCVNGGSCLEGRCHCPAGVTGMACQEDIDECQKLPADFCQHGCQNMFGSFRCTCPQDATLNADGRTCQDKQCVPPCMNGGRCERETCVCGPGYTGTHCQHDVDECRTGRVQCEHQCLNTAGSFTCVCPPGARLASDGHSCINTTCIPACRNRGRCENHRCHCPSGFTGFVCQLDVNECRRNHGCSHQCTNSYGSYRCSCPQGFTLGNDGKTCTKDVETKG